MAMETSIKVQDKWETGTDTQGKMLVLKLPMRLDVQVTDKNGVKKTFESLAQQGSRFGGVQIGVDHEGRGVFANISIYRKPKGIATAGRNTPLEIA
jgi:hypothetical protein